MPQPPRPTRVLECVQPCIVRKGVDKDSEKCGLLERGTRITVLESRIVKNGGERVRFDAGWASVVSETGAH